MSSFWGIVFYVRNIILLGLTTKTITTQMERLHKAAVLEVLEIGVT